MSKFTKAKSEQGFFKVGLYGKTGSGKTLTSLLWAEGLAAKSGKRIAYIDTERGTEFYSMAIPERTCHPEAFDFDRIVTRSLMETLEAVEGIDTAVHGVLVLDSITHLWEAARNSYTGKKLANGGIPIQAWNDIKRPYKRLMSLFLDGAYHSILCGREGIVMDKDEDGEIQVTGTKMKAEGETPYEPHVLGRMVPEQDQGTWIYKVYFEKDRSGILANKTYSWPTFETIKPVVAYLTGDLQGTLGTPEDAAEIDAEMQERASQRVEAERRAMYETIRTALVNSRSADDLKAAWSMTTGKKGKLGEYHEQLATIKDARKAEILGEVA